MLAALKDAYLALNASTVDLVTAFREEMPLHCKLDSGASRLLDALRTAGIPFGIVTNGSRYQLDRIHALGLAPRTSCIFVSELIACRKPEAAIFLSAAACPGVHPEKILFVGDTPEADIVGAHRVGMRTAWLRRDERPWPAHLAPATCDLTVAALDELLR